MMQKVPVKILCEGAALPTYGTANSAGADLRACLDAPVVLAPGETRLIPIGIAMEIPEGYVGLVFARSGLASRRDLAPANKVGVVDSDYRGEFFVPMRNHGAQPQTIEPGERIAQFILTPYLTAQFFETETLTDTARGEGGFGYDPLFLYEPLGRSFAELSGDEKNAVSHRGRAMRALADRLAQIYIGGTVNK